MIKYNKLLNVSIGFAVFCFLIYSSLWLNNIVGNLLLSIITPLFFIFSFMITIIDLNASLTKRVQKFFFWIVIIHIIAWLLVYLLNLVNSVSPDQNPNTTSSSVTTYFIISVFLQISVITTKLISIIINKSNI